MSELDPSNHPEIVDLAWAAAQASNRAFDVRRDLDKPQTLVNLAIEAASNETSPSPEQARVDAEAQIALLTDMAAPIMLSFDSPFSSNEIAPADHLSIDSPRQHGEELPGINAGRLIAQLLVAQPHKTLSVEELTRTLFNSDGSSIKSDRHKILALISDSELGITTQICHDLQNNGLVLQVGRLYEYDAVSQQRSSFFARVVRAIARAEVIDEAGVYTTEVTDSKAEIDWQTILILPS